MLKIQSLSELTSSERQNLISRSAIDISQIHNDLITPMAAKFAENSWEALQSYVKQFDFLPEKLVLNREDMKIAFDKLQVEAPEIIDSFQQAYQNIKEFHQAQVPQDITKKISGNQLGLKHQPFDAVALYVPGGKALYPSTVLMGVTPAAIAGVEDITICSPPDSETGAVHTVVQAMAYLAGATRILQAGGAQSILAAAMGIPSLEIPKADFIYGPGNKYVAAAKSFVYSKNIAGIDSFAGPSEVCIIADDKANPHYLAHDLLAQAEHDEDASAVLLCTSIDLCKETISEIDAAIAKRGSRAAITQQAIEKNGHILVVDSLEEAFAFSNEYAPEHLEIHTETCESDLEKIKAAGSVFLGNYSPVAVGDYFSGTNHILPTGGACRFASGVGVSSFYRRISYQLCSADGLRGSARPIEVMSKVEGLFDEHGYSVLARFPEMNINE